MFTPVSINAQTILCKRYLLPVEGQSCSHCGKSHETIDQMFWRASFGVQEFHDLMARLDFLPNSPTLMNAGTVSGQLSACYKLNIKDTMLGPGGITDTATKAVAIQKFGGGVGYNFNELRPKGAPISTTHGVACGVVSVMSHMHSVAKMVTQGGKREGAQMGLLSISHPDILEFIHSKDDLQAFSTFNISISIPDSFMEAVLADSPWDLISPQDHSVWRTVQARDLWDEICGSAWRTGDPGVFFVDTVERANPTPWLGKLDGSNPCGEVPLLDGESCNLGSINLVNFVQSGGFDYSRLREVVRTAVRFLDRILTENKFPMELFSEAALRTRKLGLGVMGWADTLALLGIHYDSDEAVDFAETVMSSIQKEAHLESERLAREYGPYPASTGMDHYQSSPAHIRRNAALTCIAPTGTVSQIAGCSSGIEPHFALENERVMGDGTVLHERVAVLDRLDGFTPHVARQISPEWHVRHQAAFQKYVDLAVSKTVNMAESATPEDISNTFFSMWKAGVKGGTIFRDGSRVGVLTEVSNEAAVERYPEERPRRLPATVTKLTTGHGNLYMSVTYKDGKPFEAFSHLGKAGGCDSAQLEAISRLISLAFRSGIQTPDIVKQLQGITCCPTWDNGVLIRSIPDGMARVLTEVAGSGDAEVVVSQVQVPTIQLPTKALLCPECFSTVYHQEGCLLCPSCGYSRC